MNRKILYSITFGFAFGVLLRSYVPIEMPVAIFILVSVFSIFLFITLAGKRSGPIFLLSIFLFSFAIGAVRFSLANKPIERTELYKYESTLAVFEGVIIDDPDERESNVKLNLKVMAVNDATLAKEELVLVTVDKGSSYAYGDELKLSGMLSRPANFVGDFGKEFDYISYLRKDGIYFEIKNPQVELVSHKKGTFVKTKLLLFKNFVEAKFNYYIPSPEQGLMSGILLGSKQALGGEWRDKFIRTGTIHIIALSGYNVTIVAEWLMKFFGLIFATTISVWVGIVGIIFFAIMTGAGSTIVRASIMAILVLISRIVGRDYDIGRALLLAGLAMIIINPWILAFDVSFQLSFLATIGLVYLSPKIRSWFYFLTERFSLRELVTATVATNIFVMPFIIYKMGIFSVVALPTNILVLPLIPITMLFGILLIAVSIVPIVGTIVGAICYGLLKSELSVIQYFASLPFASISISYVPLVVITLAYAGLLYWMFYPQHSPIDI